MKTSHTEARNAEYPAAKRSLFRSPVTHIAVIRGRHERYVTVQQPDVQVVSGPTSGRGGRVVSPTLDDAAMLAALCSVVVGDQGLHIAAEYFGAGSKLEEIAEMYGVPKSTLADRLNRLWSALEQHNATPPTWTKPRRGGQRRINTFNTKCRDFYERNPAIPGIPDLDDQQGGDGNYD